MIGIRKMFVKLGNEMMINENRKSLTSNVRISSVAAGPIARSFIAHAKSPHSSQQNNATRPPIV